jgi:hypothetical protein
MQVTLSEIFDNDKILGKYKRASLICRNVADAERKKV